MHFHWASPPLSGLPSCLVYPQLAGECGDSLVDEQLVIFREGDGNVPDISYFDDPVAIGRHRALRIPRGVSTTPRAGTESSATESLLDLSEMKVDKVEM